MRIVGELEAVRHDDQVERVLRERQEVRVGNERGRGVIIERPARHDAALRQKRTLRKPDLQRMEPEDVGDGTVEVRLFARKQIAAKRGREPLGERR